MLMNSNIHNFVSVWKSWYYARTFTVPKKSSTSRRWKSGGHSGI